MRMESLHGTAYSYIRFSSKEQEQGDSIRRQRQLRDDWLKLNPQITLDTTLGGEDLGVSSFRGAHRSDKHILGQFLDAVRRNRVASGSILLIENLDRLSREDEDDALALLLSLRKSGIVIVQLEPYTVFQRGDGMAGLMKAVLYFSLAREESQKKSKRVSEAWRARQKGAVANKEIVTARCPAWLQIRDGKFHFKDGARDTLRRIFTACINGHGARAIATDLDRDKVPQFAGNRWQSSYITSIVNKRETTGEYQAYHRVGGKRVKNGPPVADYFPAAVTEAEWRAAQKATKSRKRTGGRRGTEGWVALFPAVYDATNGERMQVHRRSHNGVRYRVLQQAGVAKWGSTCRAFQLDTFETEVLGKLAELRVDDILPPVEDGGRVANLSRELAEVETRLARIQTAMIEGEETEAALPVLRELDRRRGSLAKDLAAAQQEVASPAHEQFGTLKGLVNAVATDPDARVRVRAGAARLIHRIYILVTSGNDIRLAAVQVRFADQTKARNYLICRWRTKQGVGGTKVPARSCSRTFLEVDAGGFDFRKAEDARKVQQLLDAIDPALLDAPAELPTESAPATRRKRGAK